MPGTKEGYHKVQLIDYNLLVVVMPFIFGCRRGAHASSTKQW